MPEREKIIGVLGGMGPEATLQFFRLLLRLTPAAKDQDHLRIIIDDNPKVPDRTEAILGRGPSPVPALVESAGLLQRAGADFIAIPCVSAHFFLEELRQKVSLPILSIFDAVAETIEQEHPDLETVGLMATTGTVQGGLFQARLKAGRIETLVPEEASQARIMAAIYDIKNAKASRSRARISADLAVAAGRLVGRGAQAIVAGCTEIPLALGQEQVSVPYFDSLRLLARAAIRAAGREPAGGA